MAPEHRWRRPARRDWIIAAASGMVGVVVGPVTLLWAQPVGSVRAFALSVAIVAVCATAVAWRRLLPAATLLVTAGLSVLTTPIDTQPALPGTATPALMFLAVLVALAIGAAEGKRARSAAARMQAERVEQAEQLRILDARTAATAERLRIARDLHDAVANRLSAVVMRITAAEHVRADPDRTDRADDTAGELGKEVAAALTELRAILTTLRSDDRPAQGATTARAQDVPLLVDDARRRGDSVTLDVVGTPAWLSPAQDYATYRIVQEALTNVHKHARPPHAHVRLHYQPEAVHIVVEDDGRSPPETTPPGHGLIGIQEHASACGGWARAGPRPRQGWAVIARLPHAPDRHDTAGST